MSQNDHDEVGYQVAVDLWGTVVETSWSRFNAMVVANSIIIGLLGTILNKNDNKDLLVFAGFLSLIGVFLTILWLSLMARDSKFQRFYSRSARSFERRLFEESANKTPSAPHLTTLKGAKLAKGWKVKCPDDPVSPDKVDKNDKNVLEMTGHLERRKTEYNIRCIIYPTFRTFNSSRNNFRILDPSALEL